MLARSEPTVAHVWIPCPEFQGALRSDRSRSSSPTLQRLRQMVHEPHRRPFEASLKGAAKLSVHILREPSGSVASVPAREKLLHEDVALRKGMPHGLHHDEDVLGDPGNGVHTLPDFLYVVRTDQDVHYAGYQACGQLSHLCDALEQMLRLVPGDC
eukprot:scaffold3504_cov240-Pinguiococcus_pyrenoidosus.AAC.66